MNEIDRNKTNNASIPINGTTQLPVEEEKRSSLQRIFAVLALLVFLGTFIVLVYTLATDKDSGRLFACLFILMVVPCIVYLFQWIRKLIRNRKA